ncbi:MAG: four helix bundle protein [Vicinamibacterales bacterium]
MLRHNNLIAWQRADDLFIRLHRLASERFPPVERFELGSQIRRAGHSVAANIVEGVARRSPAQQLHFLNISEASLAEVAYCLHVARRLNNVTQTEYAELDAEVQRVFAPLTGLIRRTKETG